MSDTVPEQNFGGHSRPITRTRRKHAAATPRDRTSWNGSAAFWVLAVIYLVVATHLDRGFLPFFDEWDFVNLHNEGVISAALVAHNGHLSFFPYLSYWFLLDVFGLAHHLPFMELLNLLNVSCGYLVYRLAKTRISPVLAAVFGSIVMFYGAASQDLLWAFQIGWLMSTAAALAGLLFVNLRSRRGDIAACIALSFAVTSTALGLAFVAGIGLSLMLWRKDWRRLWIPVVAACCYGAWWLGWGRFSSDHMMLSGAAGMFRYAAEGAVATCQGLAFGNHGAGLAIALALGLGSIAAMVLCRSESQRLVQIVASWFIFWAVISLARETPLPIPSRYLYTSCVLVLVGGVEIFWLLRSRITSINQKNARQQIIATAAAVAMSMVGLTLCGYGGNQLFLAQPFYAFQAQADHIATGLINLDGSAMAPSTVVDTVNIPQMSVFDFESAQRRFGSIGFDAATLRSLHTPLAALANNDLLGALPLISHTVATPKTCVTAGQWWGRHLWRVQVPQHGILVTAPASSALTVQASGWPQAHVWLTVLHFGAGTSHLISWAGAANKELPMVLMLHGALSPQSSPACLG